MTDKIVVGSITQLTDDKQSRPLTGSSMLIAQADDRPKRMPVDWQTVRAVLLIAKPDWKPNAGGTETEDSRAYDFCQKVVEAYRAHLQATCSGCRQRKDSFDFFRCWDCNAYLCRECIRSHGVTNIPHPKVEAQYEAEIADLKKQIHQYRNEDEARADHDALWS